MMVRHGVLKSSGGESDSRYASNFVVRLRGIPYSATVDDIKDFFAGYHGHLVLQFYQISIGNHKGFEYMPSGQFAMSNKSIRWVLVQCLPLIYVTTFNFRALSSRKLHLK